MKRILLIGAAGLGLLAAAAVVVPFFVPKEVYKAQIEAAASDALQREVVLAGDVGLSVFPRLSASVEDVTVANAEGFEGDYMVEAGALRASVKWLPLLSQKVDIQEVAFVDAKVLLQRKADGSANWTFGDETPAPDTETPAPAGESSFDAGVAQARLVNAELIYDDAVAGTRYELENFNLEASVASLDDPLKAKGSGQFEEIDFEFDLKLDTPNSLTGGEASTVDVALKSDLGDVVYDGQVTLGDVIAMDGSFSADIPNVAASLAKFDVEIAGANLVEAVEVKGDVSGTLEDLSATNLAFKHRGSAFDAAYSGGFQMVGETQSVDGTFEFKTDDVKALAEAIELEVAGINALQQVEASGSVSGPVSALSFVGLDVSHESALLLASYKGAASLDPGGRFDGDLSASSNDLRALMAAADIVLEPGETLKTFSIDAKTGGTIEQIDLNNIALQLDDLSGRGRVGANLKGARPLITADLAVGVVDLTPFMGEADPDAPAGWSKAPLDLSSLSLLDADIALAAQTLIIDNIQLNDASLTARLRNGDLTTDLQSFKVFGGNWGGDLTLQTSRSTPALAMSFTGESILFEEMLKTFTGLDRISGGGTFKFTANSRGASLYDIMNGLNGNLSANLANGALKGIDLGKLFQVRENLVQSLAGGGISLGISANDRTEFASFDNVLTIRNGVAQIDTMELLSPILKADWLGQIDLGEQSLDMTMKLAADRTGSGQNLTAVQLNGVAIPLRITGSWTAPRIAPDTQALGSALTSGALDRVTGGLSSGSGPGNIISGLLGVPATREPAPAQEAAPADQAAAEEKEEEEEAVRPEDIARDAARRALGGLFGD